MRALGLALMVLSACDGASGIAGTTILGDTADTRGPYHVLSAVADPHHVDHVRLHYRPGDAGEAVVEMGEVRPTLYEGLIPGQPAFTLVRYYVEVALGDSFETDPPGAKAPGAALYGFWVLGASCRTDLECGVGERCDESGVCRRPGGPCATDADCGKGLRCGPWKTCLLAARSCSLDETCVSGEVCQSALGECGPRPRCGDELSCPLDFVCDPASGYCLRACVGAAECGPGEACRGGVCSGAITCATDQACSAGLICDPVLKYCRPRGAGLCAQCRQDSDCGGPTDFCLLLGQSQVCGQSCGGNACPEGYTCKDSFSPPQCVPLSGVCK